MKLFEAVKQGVTVRQVAEAYGMKPDRSGLIRCIFHNDGSPSMKVDDRYYCFGCQCTGDVIDFAVQLFGLEPVEAAKKLAEDFGIPYEYRGRTRDSPVPGRKPIVKKNNPAEDARERFRKERNHFIDVYLAYRDLLKDWRIRYAPNDLGEEWDERFCESLDRLTITEYYLDILLSIDEDEQLALMREKRKEVEALERKLGEQRTISGQDEAYGESGCRSEHQGLSDNNGEGIGQGDDRKLSHSPSGRSTSAREHPIQHPDTKTRHSPGLMVE